MDILSPETILGTCRSILVALKRKKAVIAGSCLQCGNCCSQLCIQIDGGFIESVNHFDQVCKENEKYTRFEVVRKDEFGFLIFKCKMLVNNRCSDYDNRLDFCKRYPTTNLYFTGQNLLPGCGFSFVHE